MGGPPGNPGGGPQKRIPRHHPGFSPWKPPFFQRGHTKGGIPVPPHPGNDSRAGGPRGSWFKKGDGTKRRGRGKGGKPLPPKPGGGNAWLARGQGARGERAGKTRGDPWAGPGARGWGRGAGPGGRAAAIWRGGEQTSGEGKTPFFPRPPEKGDKNKKRPGPRGGGEKTGERRWGRPGTRPFFGIPRGGRPRHPGGRRGPGKERPGTHDGPAGVLGWGNIPGPPFSARPRGGGKGWSTRAGKKG